MIKKVEHVAIIVNNMEESIRYYCDLFGFKLRTTGSNPRREMSFLTHTQQPSFEIELIRDLEGKDTYSNKGLVNHLAFTVENIQEAMEYYRGKGIVFNADEPSTAIDGGKTIFFDGPNGELLQLVEPSASRR
ncbi:VOC family protein [Alicyclobacillus tolerans]|uniref:VOC family protein n=1 Tax=Alicyclobacillus tolerans TaxID=90970 RepID=UPI001F3AF893|nr:VOC family protein [Alicyclobacillus tolerans]MCF8564287.1 VOC family protein [Alicyclobacillus tolerans]